MTKLWSNRFKKPILVCDRHKKIQKIAVNMAIAVKHHARISYKKSNRLNIRNVAGSFGLVIESLKIIIWQANRQT